MRADFNRWIVVSQFAKAAFSIVNRKVNPQVSNLDQGTNFGDSIEAHERILPHRRRLFA